MEAAEKLAADIHAETLKALEYAKSETSRLLEEATNRAKERIEEILNAVRARLEAIKDSMDKIESDVRNDIEVVCQGNSNAVKQIELETIRTLNAVWDESKKKMETACNNAVGFLGTNMIADYLKDLLKYAEQILKECIKIIQEFAETAVNEIGLIAQGIRKTLLTEAEGTSDAVM